MIAENLKRLRKEKGLSQKEVSKKIGMTPQGYQRYEKGVRNPKLATIKRIADGLGVTVSEIFGETLYGLVLPVWIPCSDRLPEEKKEVLISADGDLYIAEYEIDHGKGYWSEVVEYRNVTDVDAWMPLPEPYKEENDDNSRKTE